MFKILFFLKFFQSSVEFILALSLNIFLKIFLKFSQNFIKTTRYYFLKVHDFPPPSKKNCLRLCFVPRRKILNKKEFLNVSDRRRILKMSPFFSLRSSPKLNDYFDWWGYFFLSQLLRFIRCAGEVQISWYVVHHLGPNLSKCTYVFLFIRKKVEDYTLLTLKRK